MARINDASLDGTQVLLGAAKAEERTRRKDFSFRYGWVGRWHFGEHWPSGRTGSGNSVASSGQRVLEAASDATAFDVAFDASRCRKGLVYRCP